MSRHLGLIIGVNQYQDSAFQTLHMAENDARAIAQWLVNTRGGKWSPPDVQLVQGQLATKELVESLIAQICIHKAEKNDTILLYFAGHAFVDERTGEGYLALSNSRSQDTGSCVSLHAFTQQIMIRSQASHILLVLDCFQTGQVWDMRRSSQFDSKPLLGPTVLNMLQTHTNRLIMCSCRGNKYAPESNDQGLGPMTKSMIIGLSGPAVDTANGMVSLPDLHAFLFKSLEAQHRPQLFGTQQPPLVLVGDLPAITPVQNAEANVAAVSSSSTGSLLRQAGPFASSAQTTRTTSSSSGQLFSSLIQQTSQIQPLLEQAQQLFQAQNYPEASNLVEKVLQIAPNDVTALVLKGQLLGTAGRYGEAQNTIDHLLQIDQNNAMGWSMRAVVLSNTGQYQSALVAVERSLELDSQNPETYAIKNNIMASLATAQSQTSDQKQPTGSRLALPEKQVSAPRAFAIGLGLHILSFVAGIAGLAILMTSLPAFIGLLICSLAFAGLCVNATRGAYRYGVGYFAITFIFLIIVIGMLGASYKMALDKVIDQISQHPTILQPVFFAIIWLLAAASIPLILSLGATLFGFPARRKRRKA